MEDFIKYMQIIQEENEKFKQNLMTANRQLEELLEDTNKKIDSLRTISMETREELDKVLEKETNDFTRVALNTPSMSSLVKQETDSNMLTEETQKLLQDSLKNMDIPFIIQETIQEIENKQHIAKQQQEELKMTPEEIEDIVLNEKLDANQEIPEDSLFPISEFSKEVEQSSNSAILKVDEKVIKKCIAKSVKPGAKVKKKAKKKYLNIAGYIAASLVIGIAATPVVAHAINTSYPNQMIEEASQDYTENIFTPNTEKFYNQDKNDVDHYHDLIDIMVETKEEYENPIVGFYLIYNNLDKHCKNHKLEEILYNFNLVYQTDYTSMEDFLQKNNFKNMNEFKEYVGLQLSKLSEEERGRGM